MLATIEVPGSFGSSCTLTFMSAKVTPTPFVSWSRASSGSPDSARLGTPPSSSSCSTSSDDSFSASEVQPLQVTPFNIMAAKPNNKRRKMSAGDSSNGSSSDGDEVQLVCGGGGDSRPRCPKRQRIEAYLSDIHSEGKDVDEHFKKSLGEGYDAVFEEFSVPVKSVFSELREKYTGKPRNGSSLLAPRDPNSVVICEEEAEDHFFKALGAAWESIQSGNNPSDDPSDAAA